MKFLKMNQKGIAHILAPIAFIGIFAAIGGAVMLRSHAATVSNNSHILYGIVKLNGALMNNAQVKLCPYGKCSTDKSFAYTNNTGYYSIYVSNIYGHYEMHVSKGISGTRYCANRSFYGYYSTSGIEEDFSLSHSAC